ncbi:NYN domain-containing protein [Amycolatopsis japonica]|uniref:NYN domain-containing protein n=1 Tax=Amycolatopsis japonica TaxID=208439 RepID=UPI0033DAFE2B
MLERVVVFLDYQNVYKGARSAFHDHWEPHWQGQINPVELAEHLAQDSPFDRELAQVRVYRGQPVNDRDAKGYAASRRQHSKWENDPRLLLITRPLRYPVGWPDSSKPGEKPGEKGIDVALTMDFAVMAVREEYDVGIMFSTDTDLKPALEFVASLSRPSNAGRPRPEVAAWSADGQHNRRLSITQRSLYCHWVGKDIYQRIQDTTNYTQPS